MGLLDALPWVRRAEAQTETALARVRVIHEARPVRGETHIPRSGYVPGIPEGGTRGSGNLSTMGWQQRTSLLQQLIDVYNQCPWVSACADAVARTVTSGGIAILPDPETIGDDGDAPDDPPGVVQAKQLFRYVNETMDVRQFFRIIVTQLIVLGDAYAEVVRVGGVPYALYPLPAHTMEVDADEHGQINGYVQHTPGSMRPPVEFDVDQVIHWSLDSAEGGLYGVGPVQKALTPITAWLFTEGYLKEAGRRGFPPRIHADLQKENEKDADIWWSKYMSQNMGAHNVGTPIMTLRGGSIANIANLDLVQILEVERALRDQIVSEMGVPPHKVGIIESGNLGGGTGESQDVTFKYNIVDPIAGIISEKIDYHILRRGFGVQGWHSEFPGVDYRDSKTIEEVNQLRFRAGAYSLNRYRREIGEPPIEGGDDAVIIERGNFLFPRDIPAYVAGEVARNAAPWIAAGAPAPVIDAIMGITPEMRADLDAEAKQQAAMDAQAKIAAASAPKVVPAAPNPAQPPTPPQKANPAAPPAKPPASQPFGDVSKAKAERGPDEEQNAVSESWLRAYRARRRRVLKDMPPVDA